MASTVEASALNKSVKVTADFIFRVDGAEEIKSD
jgi:hypothetical protein